MTRAQEMSIERLKKLIAEDCKDLREEIKKFEVKDFERFVSVYVVLGYENDEGTYAMMARDYAHFYIGKRGGVSFPVHGKNGQYYISFKWYSTLQVICRQRHNY